MMDAAASAAPRDITVILPYYRNSSMIDLHLDRIESYPDDLRRHLQLIVVDDGSPKFKLQKFTPPALVKVQLFRIEKDVRWNWLAARNIGQHHARTNWRLMTDIDHMIPEATARRMICGKLDPENIYRFSRVNYPHSTPYHPHPNSWLMTGAMFEKTGGYDERFSGFYGTDGMYRDRCAAAAHAIIILDEALERVDRKEVADASTTTYERKAPQDKEAVPRIRREIEASGDLTPHRLTFQYTQIQ